ncbi:GNAT family N-acetyltransferase [Microvirga sp. 2TAF3]|uniref:GNAT family N-acetyltransferase n=1 Tax=Microvirga sp. 2TAF3 TaxID=3233014 RepID=UPI003F9A2ABA
MTLRIRDGHAGDVDGVARVHVQGWRESYKDFLNADSLAGRSVEERARMWRDVLAKLDPEAKFLVVEDANGAIVGFARGGPVREKGSVPLGTEAELYVIYLIDRVKRRGLGRRLTMGVFDHLAQSFSSVGLWVLKQNFAARGFYEALGGKATVEQPLELRGQTVTEIGYRFEPIPRSLISVG